MKSFLTYLRKAFVLTLTLLLLCAVVYPLALTGLGQAFFGEKAEGSLIEVNGKPAGSALVGQQFTDDRYFRGRVSSVGYNTYTEQEAESGAYTGPSSGSFNYGPTNSALLERAEADAADFKERYKEATGEDFTGKIPADLLTASGSGLDPHISPAAAAVQVPVVAANTGLSEEAVRQIVQANTEHKVIGIFGEERVNVLKCNIAVAKAIGEI